MVSLGPGNLCKATYIVGTDGLHMHQAHNRDSSRLRSSCWSSSSHNFHTTWPQHVPNKHLMCLCVCASACLPVCLSACLSAWLALPPLTACGVVALPASACLCLPLPASACLCLPLPATVCLCLSLSVSVCCLGLSLSVSVCLCLSLSVSFCLRRPVSVCLSPCV